MQRGSVAGAHRPRTLRFLCFLCVSALAVLSPPVGAESPRSQGEGERTVTVPKTPVISGARVEASEDSHSDQVFLGYASSSEVRPSAILLHFSTYSRVRPQSAVDYVIFGNWLDEIEKVAFTNQNCSEESMMSFGREDFSLQTDKRVVVQVSFPEESKIYRLCYRDNRTTIYTESHEVSTFVSTSIPDKVYYFPFPMQIGIVTVLLMLSGLFSGLNLGLMALSPQELTLIQKSGSKTERRYAETILPVRERGNLLLCSLLIGNVMVNSGISILLDDLTGSGYLALIASSAGIVVFGEIFPQSLCVKKGLAVGAHTIWLTRFFMVLTMPIAFPISKLLDYILGDEVVAYDRRRLMELIKMSTRDEEGLAEELKIAVGAMEISDKTVEDVMTKIQDVFMLPDTTTLNTKTVAEILRMGYTRIPVFSGDRNNVVALLFVKDLALLDPDDNFTIQTVCNYHQHALRFVDHSTPLRAMLEEFKKGEYHLAMVTRMVTDEECDPYFKLLGVVTLEDIVEEILQAEIVDETDAVTDNVHRNRRKAQQGHELSCLLDGDEATRVISVQMQLVCMQWLTSNIAAFHSDVISPNVLEKLIRQHVRRVELSHLPDMYDKKTAIPRTAKLYTKQEYSERFILILEGRAIVTIGQDSMTFEAGPWYAFGQDMLQKLVEQQLSSAVSGSVSRGSLAGIDGSGTGSTRKPGFIPDFSVVVLDDCTFLDVSATSWCLAYKTTQISRGGAPRPSVGDGEPGKSSARLVNGVSGGSSTSLDEKSVAHSHSARDINRVSSYVTPQHNAVRRLRLEGLSPDSSSADGTKPRSASECSEGSELIDRGVRSGEDSLSTGDLSGHH